MMVGKAIIKAKLHAFSHIVIILLTKPMLKTLITKDIIPDIRSAIKNEKTTLKCLFEIMGSTHILG